MSTTAEDRDRLARENPRFRSLVERHREYERRLGELQARRWLSAEERLEEVQLKKKKLAAKDEMESILRRSAG